MCTICKEERDFDWLICKMPQELTSGDPKKIWLNLRMHFSLTLRTRTMTVNFEPHLPWEK